MYSKGILFSYTDYEKKISHIENMGDTELERYIYQGLRVELNTINQFCKNCSIEIKGGESFIRGLKLYLEKYCTELARKEFYNVGNINTFAEFYELNIKII